MNVCLEGIFAHGSTYVAFSRSTDPAKLNCIGLPPKDLLDDVAKLWLRKGYNVHYCMAEAASVTGEWEYDPSLGPSNGWSSAAAENVFARLKPKRVTERRVPLQLRTLEQVLRPQPMMADVVDRFLDWIGRENQAVRDGLLEQPEFKTLSGEEIFPAGEDGEYICEFARLND